MLLALLPHLSGEQQLEFLLSLPKDSLELLDFRDHFKGIATSDLDDALRQAESDCVALRRVLFLQAQRKRPSEHRRGCCSRGP